MKNNKSGGVKQTRKSLGIPLNDEIFLQPWFVPKAVYAAIRRLLPGIHHAKMRYYFDDYGCLRCGEKRCLYGSNGLCERCTVRVRCRVVQSLRKRLKQAGVSCESPFPEGWDDQGRTARRMLRDIVLK